MINILEPMIFGINNLRSNVVREYVTRQNDAWQNVSIPIVPKPNC
jgi:hypothetical protein